MHCRPTAVRTSRGLSIAGTRMTLYSIMDYIKAGWPPELIRDRLNLTDYQIADVMTYLAEQRFAIHSGSPSLVVADFNTDGLPDLATSNTDTDDVSVLRGLGGGEFGVEQRYGAPGLGGPQDIAVADMNGDGLPDLIVSTLADSVSILLGE